MGKPLVKNKNKGEEEEALRSPYRRLGQPGAYSGSEVFLKAINVKRAHSKDGVRRVLQGEPSYTLHRPVRRKFPRRKTIFSGPFDQCQCDLVDVSAYKKENDGVRFLLCAVDVVSKYAWVRALKEKTGKEVSQAFEDILHEAGRDPLHVQTDKGKEFRTSAFEGVAKRRGIEVFSSENNYIKASPVERFQQTLQNIMHHHFTSSRSRSFLKVLPEMVLTYNTTYHCAIGMALLRWCLKTMRPSGKDCTGQVARINRPSWRRGIMSESARLGGPSKKAICPTGLSRYFALIESYPRFHRPTP